MSQMTMHFMKNAFIEKLALILSNHILRLTIWHQIIPARSSVKHTIQQREYQDPEEANVPAALIYFS